MKRQIVLVVDELKETSNIADITRNDWEGNSADQTLRLEQTLRKIAPVIRYIGPQEFELHVKQHLNDIVFPMYYGSASSTSKGIVPALCEANNIDYIGADLYAQIICNDKSLSKLYASNFGIHSAHSVLLRCPVSVENVIPQISLLPLPLIVKPNFGGGSTGISDNGLAYSYQDAATLACKLYKYLGIPILVEEYIEGYEVELIVAGNQQSIHFCEEVQLLIDDREYFKQDIWGFESKSIDDSKVDFRMSSYISEKDKNNLKRLFLSFKKLEMIRFDGRVRDNNFYLLELSPDCYLGDDCAFYFAFESKGYSHAEMFKFLINLSLNHD